MSIEDLARFADALPAPEDALPDEELEGYVLGVRDALRIVRGDQPQHDPRRVWGDGQ